MAGFIFEDFPFHQTATTGPPVPRPRVTVQLLRFSPACYVGAGVVARLLGWCIEHGTERNLTEAG